MAQLRDLDVTAWDTGANEWKARCTNLLATVRDLHDNLDPQLSAGAWTGSSGDAALTHLRGVTNGLEIDALECQAVSLVLSGLTHAFRISQNSLRSALGTARVQGFPVGDDGTVGMPDTELARHDPEYAASCREQRDHLQTLVRLAVDAATVADQKAYEMLDHLSQQTFRTDVNAALNEDVGMASKLEIDLIAATVPAGDPAAVGAWWAGLSPEDQQTVRMAAPWALENLNGIPADVRAALHGTDGYDRTGVAKWAIDHGNDNSDDIFRNNCTNFVSDALEGGGVQEHFDFWLGTLSDNSWGKGTQFGKDVTVDGQPVDRIDYSHSSSWAQAQDSYDFWTRHGSEVGLAEAQPGDIVYWEQTETGDGAVAGEVHHAAVVTGVVDGDIRYTQHTFNQVNASLEARAPISDLGGAPDQRIHVVRPQPDW
ncbi:amidase domain-containing protein [Actinoplanes sp. HUAS TT8]|uniref:amidase domain-containing protein n=1 Tax=Actinoplanes sp. HUAS TT8 TaxID=3447453 RepID=UPI003F52157B